MKPCVVPEILLRTYCWYTTVSGRKILCLISSFVLYTMNGLKKSSCKWCLQIFINQIIITRDQAKAIQKKWTITAWKASELEVFLFQISAYGPEQTKNSEFFSRNVWCIIVEKYLFKGDCRDTRTTSKISIARLSKVSWSIGLGQLYTIPS